MGKQQHSIEYHDLAIMQIHEAIDLYDKNTLGGFVSACTLSHAASGILEGLPARKGLSFEKIKEHIATKRNVEDKDLVGSALNFFPNSLKHFKEEFCETDTDPFINAQACIFRAILALIELGIPLTEKMHDWVTKIKSLRTKNSDVIP